MPRLGLTRALLLKVEPPRLPRELPFERLGQTGDQSPKAGRQGESASGGLPRSGVGYTSLAGLVECCESRSSKFSTEGRFRQCDLKDAVPATTVAWLETVRRRACTWRSSWLAITRTDLCKRVRTSLQCWQMLRVDIIEVSDPSSDIRHRGTRSFLFGFCFGLGYFARLFSWWTDNRPLIVALAMQDPAFAWHLLCSAACAMEGVWSTVGVPLPRVTR